MLGSGGADDSSDVRTSDKFYFSDVPISDESPRHLCCIFFSDSYIIKYALWQASLNKSFQDLIMRRWTYLACFEDYSASCSDCMVIALVDRISAAFQGGMTRIGPTGSLYTKLIVPGLSFCGMDPVTPDICAAISFKYSTEVLRLFFCPGFSCASFETLQSNEFVSLPLENLSNFKNQFPPRRNGCTFPGLECTTSSFAGRESLTDRGTLCTMDFFTRGCGNDRIAGFALPDDLTVNVERHDVQIPHFETTFLYTFGKTTEPDSE